MGEINMKNLHTILGFSLPTNEPETAFEYILTSLENLKAVAPISTFLINFQKPWTEEQINKAVSLIESYGFEVRWSFNEYEIKGKGLVPFNRIRDDACKLMPEAFAYALTDDDMTYKGSSPKMKKNAGEQFLDSIHYLLHYEKCGMVLFGGSLYKKTPNYQLQPVDIINTYITGRGLIFRNLGDDCRTIPKECLDFVGSDEEKISAAYRLAKGYYPAKLRMARVHHYENHRAKESKNPKKNDNKLTSGAEQYGWNDAKILDENNLGYIKEHYNPEFKGKDNYNVCSFENYTNAGGINVYDEEVVKKYNYNYENKTSEEVLNEIINKFNQ